MRPRQRTPRIEPGSEGRMDYVEGGYSVPAATGGGGGTGTVTSVSVVTANSISGTVANATTTPAITLQFNATSGQILVGNASNIAAPVTMSGDATITNAGVVSVSKTRLVVRNETGSTIATTRAVIMVGFNNVPLIGLADNTDEAKHNVIGLTVGSIATSANGYIATAGECDAETNAWPVGTELYWTTSGNLSATEPTSGEIKHIGIVTVQQNYPVGKVLIYNQFEGSMRGSGVGGGLMDRLGDSAGATKWSLRNYANVEVFSINSLGQAVGDFAIHVNSPLTGTGTTLDPVSLGAGEGSTLLDVSRSTAGTTDVTIPAGIYYITLTLQAAGGNGYAGAGKGGNGGQYIKRTIAVKPNNTYRITIGAVGANSTFSWVSWDGLAGSTDSGFATITATFGANGAAGTDTGANGVSNAAPYESPETGWDLTGGTGGDSQLAGAGSSGNGGAVGAKAGGAGSTSATYNMGGGGGASGMAAGGYGALDRNHLTGNAQAGTNGSGGGSGYNPGAGGNGYGHVLGVVQSWLITNPGGTQSTTITAPYPASKIVKQTVTDASVTATSKIMVTLGSILDTDPTCCDDLDLISLYAVPGTGNFSVRANFSTPFGGSLKLHYTVT